MKISAINHYKKIKADLSLKLSEKQPDWHDITGGDRKWQNTLKTVTEEYVRHWNMYQQEEFLYKTNNKNMKWVVFRVHVQQDVFFCMQSSTEAQLNLFSYVPRHILYIPFLSKPLICSLTLSNRFTVNNKNMFKNRLRVA